ncbi:MAG TPA: hypothetical protein DDZ22_21475 [Massilia sp.]|nr:hypothetical protein [Massilia sp.]
MTFDERRKRAIAVLNRKGIPQASSEPAHIRLFRRLGMQVRPLHFETFWRTTFFCGLWFAPIWALIMWLFSWRKEGTDPGVALLGHRDLRPGLRPDHGQRLRLEQKEARAP